jgi:tRNA G18 (ribose-2'-O)-methylase SpoU
MLADLAITQTTAFRNLAASTHHWQPLLACLPAALPDWLIHQRQLGYSLIALHTDSHAVPLLQFSFPYRSVLVLGQELTGLPEELLQQCDRTITIPQFGLVESLNVQTAGAIAIYEYIRQHRFTSF